MNKLFHALLSNTQGKSSARLVNLLAALALILVFSADFIINHKINVEAMMILATYGAGGFGISKGLDKLNRKDVDVPNNIT